MGTRVKDEKENGAKRTQSFRERMKAKGFVRLDTWVPAKYLHKIKEFIKGLK